MLRITTVMLLVLASKSLFTWRRFLAGHLPACRGLPAKMITEGVAERPKRSKYVQRHWATHQFAQRCAIFPAEAPTVTDG